MDRIARGHPVRVVAPYFGSRIVPKGVTAVKGDSFERGRQAGTAKPTIAVASSITLPPLLLPGTTSLVSVPPPSFGPANFPPIPLAKQSPSAAQATGNALIGRVLPTVAQQQAQVPSSLGTQTIPAPQGTMDSFTAQYAPETYKIALTGALAPSVVASSTLKEPTSTAQSVDPTYGGTNIPYFDHEIEKILAAQQGSATVTQPLPTFAAIPPTQSAPPPPQTQAQTQTQTPTQSPIPAPVAAAPVAPAAPAAPVAASSAPQNSAPPPATSASASK